MDLFLQPLAEKIWIPYRRYVENKLLLLLRSYGHNFSLHTKKTLAREPTNVKQLIKSYVVAIVVTQTN